MINPLLPDSLVWRSELSYNEPYVEYYFRHPTFNYYPVVGGELVTGKKIL
jgi:formylglycine-generating enzyme